MWQNRPLDPVYGVVDRRDRDQSPRRPGREPSRVRGDRREPHGEHDVLGLWLGPTGGGAKQWATMLTELRNRGLTGRVDRVLRRSQRVARLDSQHVARRDRSNMCGSGGFATIRSPRRRGTGPRSSRRCDASTEAPTVAAAEAHFKDFSEDWADTYPAMIRSWENSWAEFVPFLEYPAELRRVVYTTSTIESLNARFQAVRHRGHFPNEQAAMKVLYLVATAKRKDRQNMTGKINGWKAILNTLSVHYGDRINEHINEHHHRQIHRVPDTPVFPSGSLLSGTDDEGISRASEVGGEASTLPISAG